MTVLLSVVSFLVVIIVIVLAHELGHFAAAKACHIKVEEFGLFYPPRVLSFKRGETIYSLNAIPLGGFTKMAGEEDPNVPGSLASKSIGVRLFVLGAGSIMNFLLPLLLFAIAFMVPFSNLVGTVAVQEVSPASPAMNAGIISGDVIQSIGGTKMNNAGDYDRQMQLHLGTPVNIVLQHVDGTTATVRLTPRWKPPAGQGASGVALNTENATIVRESYPFWQAIPKGVASCINTLSCSKTASSP